MPSDALIDSEVFEALHFLDGAQRRWAMRRASGQSGRDLKAAIIYELYDRSRAADFLQPGHVVSGFRAQPCLTIRATATSRPLELDIHALAVRARRLLKIDVVPDDPCAVWAICAGQTGVMKYGCDVLDKARPDATAAELMEPEHIGCDRIKTMWVPSGKVPEYIEIRRMPRPPEEAI